MDPILFRLKKIRHNNSRISICLQNENGPCPLLAIANALLLRRVITIHPDLQYIDSIELIEKISSYMLSAQDTKNLTADEKASLERNIHDAIEMIGNLLIGADVNIKFDGTFEYTKECLVFDLCWIRLCHGWIPSREDKVYDILQNLSYNQAIEMVVASKFDGETRLSHEEASKGIDIDNWLKDNASQLTSTGIFKMHEDLKEGSYSVFFRNNHFSTIHKRSGAIYILATDQGFYNSNIVWEKLEMVDGDNILVDCNFKPVLDSTNPSQETEEKLSRELVKQMLEEEESSSEPTVVPPRRKDKKYKDESSCCIS